MLARWETFIEEFTKSKGNSWEMMSLTFHDKGSFSIQTNKVEGKLAEILQKYFCFEC
jgi:hypothetical protein